MTATTYETIPRAHVVRVAQELYSKLQRTRLQQALVESRILPKNEERAWSKRICSSETSWCEFLTGRLMDEDAAELLIRMLGSLVESYIRSRPPTARSAFEEARRGAERSDGKKLRGELEKVERAAKASEISTTDDWAVLLWLGTTSPKTREKIQRLVRWDAPEQSSDSSRLPTDKPAPAALSISAGQLPTEAPDLLSDRQRLIAYLRNIAHPPSRPNWGLVELQSSMKPPPVRIKLPDTKVIHSGIEGLTDRIRALIDLAKSPATAVSLPGAVEALKALVSASDAAHDLIEKAESEMQISARNVESALMAMGPEFATQVKQVRELGQTLGQWQIYVEQAQELVMQYHAALAEKHRRIFEVADAIEQNAAYLDAFRRAQLGEAVQSAAGLCDLARLELYLAESETERKSAESVRAATLEPATRSLTLIEGQSNGVPDEIAAACLQLFQTGSASLGYAILSRCFEPRALASAAAGAKAGPGAAPERVAEPEIIKRTRTILNFRPRNRETLEFSLPTEPRSLVGFLYQRAETSLKAESIIGLIDHALDILSVAREVTEEGPEFAHVGLALLATPRREPGTYHGWGERMAEALPAFETAMKPETLVSHCKALLTRPAFDEIVAERFLYREVAPYADILASALCSSAESDVTALLEDIARGVGNAVRYGDLRMGRTLLMALARASGAGTDATARLEKSLDSMSPAAKPDFAVAELAWIEPGLQAYHSVRRGLRHMRGSSGRPNVEIPRSIKSAGGFSHTLDKTVLEIAILVTNPTNEPFHAAEILISAKQNRWMMADVVEHIGPLAPESRCLVPLRLDLADAAHAPGTLSLEYRLSFKDASKGGITRQVGDSLPLPLRESSAVTIDDYPGANSQPIILEGEVLGRSPSSLKNALSAIVKGLSADGVAVLLYGRRRRGKTSLLRTLERSPDIQQRYCVLLDTIEHRPFDTYLAAVRHLGDLLDEVALRLDVIDFRII